ncbi:unnamed protein product [Musa textilis]
MRTMDCSRPSQGDRRSAPWSIKTFSSACAGYFRKRLKCAAGSACC